LPEIIFLMRWDPRRGPVILGFYPQENVSIEKDFLINVFGTIMQREERLEGFYEVTYGGKDIITYYSGQELNQLFGTVLAQGEDKEGIRGGVVRAALVAFRRGEPPATLEEWKEIWDRITKFPMLTYEQRVADAFRDIEARKTLEVMLENGIIEMERLLDNLKASFPHLSRDVLLTYVYLLESLGILQTKWDEKALLQRVYLLRDVVFHRKKPEKFEEIAKEIEGYIESLEKYAREYQEGIWETDQAILPEVLGDPATYDILAEFRERGTIPVDEAQSRGWTTIVEKLVNLEIIKEAGERYYLFTDPTVKLLLPKYTFSIVVRKLRDEELSKEIVLDYLRTVRASYLE